MDYLIGFLFFLALALAIVAVVGHLIWVLAAKLLKMFVGKGLDPACPKCGRNLPLRDGVCISCRWDATSRPVAMSDLDVTARQLKRFLDAGQLDLATYSRVMLAVDQARQQATSSTAAAPPTRPPVVRSAPAPILGATSIPQPVPRPSYPTEPAETPVQPTAALTPTADLPPVPHPPASGTPSPSSEDAPKEQLHVLLTQQIAARAATRHPGPIASAPRPLPSPPPPPPPAKPWSEVLARFMEDRNIRWGELIGGMLIVGCSLALIISLWSTIAHTPWIKFFLFTAVTGAVFGIGFYTDRHWKLPLTSRGTLMIATLLVPLNLLAILAFARAHPTAPLALLSQAVALLLFAVMVHRAGRSLVPLLPGGLALGSVGSAAVLAVIQLLAVTPMPLLRLEMLALLPAMLFVGCTLALERRGRMLTTIGTPEAYQVFRLLGSTGFASLLALGFLLYASHAPAWALQRLGPLTPLWGMPLVAVGLWLWKALPKTQTTLGIVATCLWLFGALLGVAGIVLAWPNPDGMLPATLLNALLLLFLARRVRLPELHLLALPCLVLAYWLGVLRLTGRIGWSASSSDLLAALLAPASAYWLAGGFALLAALGLAWRKAARVAEAAYSFWVCGGVGMISLALGVWHGAGVAGDPHGLCWLLALYTLSALLAAWFTRHKAWTILACLLLAGFLVQLCVYRVNWAHGWSLALLVDASVTAAAMAALWPSAERRTLFAIPLRWSAILASGAAVLLLMGEIPAVSGALVLKLFWLAGIWGVLAWWGVEPIFYAAMRIVATFAVALAAGLVLRKQAWFATAPHPWLDAWTLQTQGIVIALFTLPWLAMRGLLRRSKLPVPADSPAISWHQWRAILPRLVQSPAGQIDRVIPVMLALLQGILILSSAIPGLADELSTVPERLPLWPFDAILPTHAWGLGAWLLLATVLLTLLVCLWERVSTPMVLVTLFSASTVTLLLAGPCQSQRSVASAWRWSMAGFFFFTSALLWARSGWQALACRTLGCSAPPQHLARLIRSLLVTLALAVIVGLTSFVAGQAMLHTPVVGPASTSGFARMGRSASFLVPLAVLIVTFAGHAIRERSSGYALGGGLVLNLTVTLACLLQIVAAGRAPEADDIIRLVQWNTLASAVYAWLWIALRHRLGTANRESRALALQLHAPLVASLLLLGLAVMRLVIAPGQLGVWLMAAGSPLGWTATVLILAATLVARRQAGRKIGMATLPFLLAFIASLGVLTLCRWDHGQWLGYHALLVAAELCAWGMLIVAALRRREPQENAAPSKLLGELHAWGEGTTGARGFTLPTIGFASAALLLALRGISDDPSRPWWSIGGFVGLIMFVVFQALLHRQPAWLYAAGGLGNLAVSVWYATTRWQAVDASLRAMIEWNLLALTVPALLWLVLELRWFRQRRATTVLPAFHHVAALAGAVVMALLVAVALANDATGGILTQSPALLDWITLSFAAALMMACLWDSQARYVPAGMYVMGLLAAGMALHAAHLPPERLLRHGQEVLAGFALLTALAWRFRAVLRPLPAALHVPLRSGQSLWAWLSPATVALALAVLAMAWWIVCTGMQREVRLVAASVALLPVAALVLLAETPWQNRCRELALSLGTLAAVAWGWAWLNAGMGLLDHVVVTLSALALAAILPAVGVTKALPQATLWHAATRRLLPVQLVLIAACLLLALGAEITQFASVGAVHESGLSLLLVAIVLAALAIGGLALALLPGYDPLRLSERGRTAYVYASEGLLALLFVHLRITAPWLFGGMFQRYWPLVIVGLAYAGVGVGAWCESRSRRVLSESLQRTGALLPLLPVLAYWAMPSQVHYSALLLAAGLLYSLLAVMRKSFGFGLLAGLAGNGALWYMLGHVEGFGFLEHPQLWLIPCALTVLVAATLNRRHLSAQQTGTIRYLALMMIYLSSTSEIFLRGVATAPWLPLVLAGLAVSGVLVGIWWQVRAFLFSGAAFLLLAIVTMLWHASAHWGWTWVWYVAGILLGGAILMLFAMFEKRRQDMLRMVETVRSWEP